MTVDERVPARTWSARLLGTDEPADLIAVLALFAGYLVLDRLIRSSAVVERADLDSASIQLSVIAGRWWSVGAVIVALAAAWLIGRRRFWCPWGELERGSVLRRLTGGMVVVLVWQSAFYPYNWLAERSHLVDRLLVIGFAVASIRRPAFLVPFALVVRTVNEQFLLPFGTVAGRNIDDVLVMGVIAVASIHLLYVVSGRNRTSAVLLLLAALVAGHFFIPGRGKLTMGWLTSGDISNLPLAGYTAGWLGHTDGGWAETLSEFVHRFETPMRIGTMAIELGSVAWVMHPRTTRWWLIAVIGFHGFVFAAVGFWFVPWLVLEGGLLLVLWLRSTRDWVATNVTPARAAITAAAVIGAPVLFHPPGLAWLDAPVSYGMEIEATGESGAEYAVPLSRFAPLDHHLAFLRVPVYADAPATAAYGALISTTEYESLAAITSFDELDTYQAALPRVAGVESARAFFEAFLAGTQSSPLLRDRWWNPPSHFWTSRSGSTYGFEEPLVELEVYIVRSIHGEGDVRRDRQLALTVEWPGLGGTVVDTAG